KVRAQMTAAKQTRIHEQNLAKAEESLNSAQRSVRKEAQVYIAVPPTHLAAGTKVLHLQLPANAESRSEFIMVGPEHLRIAGKNGSGRSEERRVGKESRSSCGSES